jgi:hypothetical protein
MTALDWMYDLTIAVNIVSTILSAYAVKMAHARELTAWKQRAALEAVLVSRFGCAVQLTDHGDHIQVDCSIVQRPEGDRVTYH